MIKDIEERLGKATPGPWKYTVDETDSYDCGTFENLDSIQVMHFGSAAQFYPVQGEEPNDSDKELIEHLHSDIQYLLSLVKKQETKLVVAMKALDDISAHELYPVGIAIKALEALKEE